MLDSATTMLSSNLAISPSSSLLLAVMRCVRLPCAACSIADSSRADFWQMLRWSSCTPVTYKNHNTPGQRHAQLHLSIESRVGAAPQHRHDQQPAEGHQCQLPAQFAAPEYPQHWFLHYPALLCINVSKGLYRCCRNGASGVVLGRDVMRVKAKRRPMQFLH